MGGIDGSDANNILSGNAERTREMWLEILCAEAQTFQPMNVDFEPVPPIERCVKKVDRNKVYTRPGESAVPAMSG